MAEERLARAIKAETDGRALAEQLANQQRLVAEALLEVKRLSEGNTRMSLELEGSKAELRGAKQGNCSLERNWNHTRSGGFPGAPEQGVAGESL